MSDPRVCPLIELDHARIGEMLRPALGDVESFEAARIEGGLVNTIYRITFGEEDEAYALRVYAAQRRSKFEHERRILEGLRGRLPVPQLLFADAKGEHPYIVYQWIEGILLNECRRREPPDALQSLASPIGRLLAEISGIKLAEILDAEYLTERSLKIEEMLAATEEMLRRGLARKRLGTTLADALRRLFDQHAPNLCALEDSRPLVHGDMGGRNIIVRPAVNGAWRVSGLIDWESATRGSPLWDVGSLFRYSKRYAEQFQAEFERGYKEAGGMLPCEWMLAARIPDATRLVSALDDERKLPVVFAECRELLEELVAV
jgi:aminoglycoside phosphotransferase (APT) family kinase protein